MSSVKQWFLVDGKQRKAVIRLERLVIIYLRKVIYLEIILKAKILRAKILKVKRALQKAFRAIQKVN
jgi:hypothetical protein